MMSQRLDCDDWKKKIKNEGMGFPFTYSMDS